MADLITHEELTRILRYDPETGQFWRRVQRQQYKAGEKVGWLDSQGYIGIRLCNRRYGAHRLAWFYVNSRWPKEIDHINGIRSDNRLSNLREATRTQNLGNMKKYVTNKSGIKGVYWYKRYGMWKAEIQHQGRTMCLGYFRDKRKAAEAYRVASINLHGEFARYDTIEGDTAHQTLPSEGTSQQT